MTREAALGYVMGLIVGEGCFANHRNYKISGKPSPSVAVKLHEDDPKPLLTLQDVLGGRLYGPYHSCGRRFRVWILRGPELERHLPTFDKYLPPSRKRDQFELWRSAYFPSGAQQAEMFHGAHRRKPTPNLRVLKRRTPENLDLLAEMVRHA